MKTNLPDPPRTYEPLSQPDPKKRTNVIGPLLALVVIVGVAILGTWFLTAPEPETKPSVEILTAPTDAEVAHELRRELELWESKGLEYVNARFKSYVGKWETKGCEVILRQETLVMPNKETALLHGRTAVAAFKAEFEGDSIGVAMDATDLDNSGGWRFYILGVVCPTPAVPG